MNPNDNCSQLSSQRKAIRALRRLSFGVSKKLSNIGPNRVLNQSGQLFDTPPSIITESMTLLAYRQFWLQQTLTRTQ